MTIMTRPTAALISSAAPVGLDHAVLAASHPTPARATTTRRTAKPSAELRAAIARHNAADAKHIALCKDWDPADYLARDRTARREEAAYTRLLAVPCRTRADALALLAHLKPTLPADPTEDTLSKLADLLERALRGEFQEVNA